MRLIHIGLGVFGRRWSEVLASSSDVEVVALVDVSEKALVAICEEYGYDPDICFPTLDDALRRVDAEVLLCVTPPEFHREHVIAGLRAGLHVLCEKPMAGSLDDCAAMLQATRETGRTIAVSQHYRYQPDMQTLARLVRRGAIGQVGQVKLDFYKGWHFGADNFRRTMPYPLIVDMSIHHFDLLRFVTGLEPVTVRGEAWNPSWSENAGATSTSLRYTMNNGARVVYNASWCAQGDFCNWNGDWLIEGDKGSIVYRNGEITLNHGAGGYKISRSETITPEKMPVTGMSWVLSHFVQSVQNGTRPETFVTDNLRSIAMVFAAVEAVQVEQHLPVLSPEWEALLADEL
jgi:predicted dehydrogenase